MTDGNIPIRTINPTDFNAAFGAGVEYAIGMGQNGEEVVLLCPDGKEWRQQGFPDMDIAVLFTITSTTYVKCDNNHTKWCCSGNVCVACGTC